MSRINAYSMALGSNMSVGPGGVLIQSPGTDGGVGSTESILSTISGIDGTALGSTLIFSAVGNDYLITKVVVRLSAVASMSNEGSASIGIGAGFDDIFPSTQMEGLNTLNKSYTFATILGSQRNVLNGEDVYFEMDTPFTALTATLKVNVFGYLLN